MSLIGHAANPQHPGSRVGLIGRGILSLLDEVLSWGPLNGSVIRDSQQNPDRQGQRLVLAMELGNAGQSRDKR